MVICVLTVSLQAAGTTRSINMLTPRVWKTWIHSRRVLMGTEAPGHQRVPKRISLTWVSPAYDIFEHIYNRTTARLSLECLIPTRFPFWHRDFTIKPQSFCLLGRCQADHYTMRKQQNHYLVKHLKRLCRPCRALWGCPETPWGLWWRWCWVHYIWRLWCWGRSGRCSGLGGSVAQPSTTQSPCCSKWGAASPWALVPQPDEPTRRRKTPEPGRRFSGKGEHYQSWPVRAKRPTPWPP